MKRSGRWSGVLSPVELCRRTHGSPLLETFAAKHGTPLRRTERNRRFLSALRAGRFRLRPLDVIALARALGTLGFAVLTPLGLVLEALVGEKHLFAGGENKFLTAFRTFQNLIVVFHTLLRGSTLVQSPQYPRPSQIVLGKAGGKLGSHFRLVRRCSGKPLGHAAGREKSFSPALAAASYAAVCVIAPVLHDASLRASCNNCVS